ncbi:hypothetical protein BN2127_JRS1_02695 [Bacillus cereus]|nr:hypothetical protein BN2127_JRS1_02695 [Bacillus cereus]
MENASGNNSLAALIYKYLFFLNSYGSVLKNRQYSLEVNGLMIVVSCSIGVKTFEISENCLSTL